jgi:transposase
MANKRHKPEEIVTKLRQVEVLVGQGMARIDAIRQVRIVEQTYYRWRKQYGVAGEFLQDCTLRSGEAIGVETAGP